MWREFWVAEALSSWLPARQFAVSSSLFSTLKALNVCLQDSIPTIHMEKELWYQVIGQSILTFIPGLCVLVLSPSKSWPHFLWCAQYLCGVLVRRYWDPRGLQQVLVVVVLAFWCCVETKSSQILGYIFEELVEAHTKYI